MKPASGSAGLLTSSLYAFFLLFAVFGVNTVLHRLLIKPLKICGWLRFHSNALHNVVAGIRPHMGGIREQQFAVNETVLNALPNHFVEQFLEQRSAIELRRRSWEKVSGQVPARRGRCRETSGMRC